MLTSKTGKWKKWLRRLAYSFMMLVFLLGMLELFYRNQWIDTYRRELNALNPDLNEASTRKKVLVMGDSFSAAPNSWVNLLRNWHPELQFINSSVPGTTILQANWMLSGRLKQFQPDLLIYQVYVGNDLFDLRYPTNWSKVGLMRNLYWSAANRLRGLAWLNYALGQVKREISAPDFQQGKVDEGEFDPQKYSERERLYLRAEPRMIIDQIGLNGDRGKDSEAYGLCMMQFLSTAQEAGVPVIVVAVPHCVQVHERYLDRMKQLGAQGLDELGRRGAEYPFIDKIRFYQDGNMRVINPMEELRACEAADIPMYYLHDAHLNDAGQQVLADFVDDALIRFFENQQKLDAIR